ncbi:MAG: hypothetical protein BM557_06360 [Flavobacterium sp. MedPE-SWcel]|uniref:hypothetical protein n=1 Tax=uncultured Flavobacterium sp. TaxID=165435 RepID=UPI00091D2189|nr:hypothetical protein [uncultured Flavobacterium sp.]OIQ19322.1 MAG: hypothetical protein BM557_06360 [Flavobacterium sp. MedPE-SWcel]
MKKAYNKLQELNSRISDCDTEMSAVQKLPFYNIFGQEAQRKKDLVKLQSLKDDLLIEKLNILEQITTEVNNEKTSVKVATSSRYNA